MKETTTPRPPLARSLRLAPPLALALCLVAWPHLGHARGLLHARQWEECGRLTDAACRSAISGEAVPATPLVRLDPTRIICARTEYKGLLRCRRDFDARLRAAKTPQERFDIRDTMVEYDDDYRSVYAQITPEARRGAHLPVPSD